MNIPIGDFYNKLVSLMQDMLAALRAERGQAEVTCVWCDAPLADDTPETFLAHIETCPKSIASYLSDRARKASVARLRKILTTNPGDVTDVSTKL